MTTPFNRVKFTPASGGTADFIVSAAVTGYNTPAQRGVADGTTASYTAESEDRSQWETGLGTYTVATTTLARTTVRENSAGTTAKINFTDPPAVWFDWHAQELTDFVAPPSAGTGVAISLTAGASSGGSGGSVTFLAGDGESGGQLSMVAGDGITGTGGSFTLEAGEGASGGPATLSSGEGTDGFGGEFVIDGGRGTTQGGEVLITAGTCTDNGHGGAITMRSGAGGVIGGDGGNLDVFLGHARGGNSSGGSFDLLAGNSFGSDRGGIVSLIAGNGGATGEGGNCGFVCGNGGGTSGNGGDVNVTTGNATSGNGGDVTFNWGTGSGRDGLFFPNLPTGDPGVAGAAYVDGSGFVKISP